MKVENMLVKDRTCGSCSVCCISLLIDQPTLKKQAGVPCANLRPQGGCSIYSDRPLACKTWHCGWRMFPLSPSMRPDISNVLIKYEQENINFITLSVVRNKDMSALLNDEVLAFVCSLISQGVNVALSIPTKKGYENYRDLINARMTDAIQQRSKRLAREEMEYLIEVFSTQKTNPIKKLS